MSDSQNFEKAQTSMETLFRTLQKPIKPAPDNRKYASNFLALHIIKV